MESDVIEIDIAKYVGIAKRWLWLIVAGALVAGAAAYAVSSLLPRIYQAEADVASVKGLSQITLSPNYTTLSEAQLAQGLDVSARQRALVAIARGNDVAADVIAELGPDLTPDEQQVANLLSMVQVTTDGDLIRIQIQSTDPQKAAKIANTWARVYSARVNRLYTETPTSLEQIQTQGDQAWANYQKAESALSDFVGQNRIDALSREIDARQKSESDLYSTQRSLDRLLQDATSFQELANKDSLSGANDTTDRLSALLIRTNAALLSYSAPGSVSNGVSSPSGGNSLPPSATANSASSAPMLPLQVQVAVNSLNDASSSSASVRSQIDALIATLGARKKQVEAQINDPSEQTQVLALQKELEQQTAKRQQLTNARDLAWTTYTTIAKKIEEVRVSEEASSTIVRVAGSAVVPEAPVAPRKSTNAMLGAAVGLVLMIALALIVELMNSGIRSSKEIVDRLRLPTFEVPLSRSALGGSIPSAYYALWANLFADSRMGKTLLIAGMEPSEEKATVAASLGMVAAQAGRSVILVDSNVVNPYLDQFFSLPNAKGWSSLAAREQPDLTDYLQPTSIKNLAVITSGPTSAPNNEWMVSPRLPLLIDSLRAKCDFMIFNCSASAENADGLLLARHVDSVLILAIAGRTSRDSALELKEQLERANANLLGVLLLRARESPVFSRLITRFRPPRDELLVPTTA